jgi:hypothetical protein
MRLLVPLFGLLPLALIACGPEGGTLLGRAPAGVRSPIGDVGRFPPGAQVLVAGAMVEK